VIVVWLITAGCMAGCLIVAHAGLVTIGLCVLAWLGGIISDRLLIQLHERKETT